MTVRQYRVLILDDDAAIGELLSDFLTNSGQCVVTVLETEVDFWEQIQRDGEFDIVFLDYRLSPHTTGLDVLTRMGQAGITIPTVMMTGEGSEAVAAKAIQAGAMDYLVKADTNFTVLLPLVQKAVRLREMQRAMQRYLEQIRYQSLLLANMRDAVVVWDTAGIITYWNTSAESLYGAAAAERVGKPASEVFFSCFAPPLTREDPQQGSVQMEHRFHLPADKTIWISSHFTALLPPPPAVMPVGTMSVARDITPRRQEQEALLQSQNFVQRVLDTSPNIILIFNLRQNKIRYGNAEITGMLGYPLADFLRLSLDGFLDLVHPEDRSILARQLQEATRWINGTVTEREFRFQSQHGDWRWLRSRETVFSRDEAGLPVEIISVLQDMTAYKAAQTSLAQAARLASIGELAAGVAHQISNPLTTILADAQILTRKLDPTHPGRESADAIIEAGWRAQQVINELMKFSQPAKGSYEPVSINRTIDTALLLAAAHIHASGIELVVDLAQNLPEIQANSRQLTDLWVNLLLQAHNAVIEGQRSFLWVVSRLEEEQAIVVQFADNGSPIADEQYDKIFEPQLFAPGDGRGTGIELSICREIVRQHRGVITVSRQNQQTVFTIKFPLEGSRV